jgi:flagellar biosynthetic protein FliS
MSGPKNTLSLYSTTSVLTASKPKIVWLLLEGAIRRLQRAQIAFEIDDIGRRNEQIHNCCDRSVQIVAELKWALDLDGGGEFSKTMFGLYGFIEESIRNGNVRKDPAPLKRAEELLSGIFTAWDEMLKKSNAKPKASGPLNLHS